MLAAALIVLAISTCFGLLAIGIRSAQQQDRIYFAVRDVKRMLMPEQATIVESAKVTTRIDGHVAFILTPIKHAEIGKRPWVWYAPTLPDLPGVEEQNMFRAFSDAGITVAGIDVGESYGSPKGNQAFDVFYREMTDVRGFSKRPVFLGRSRGGLMALSWAEKHPNNISAFAGIYPVSNIASYPGISKAAVAFELSPRELSINLEKVNPIDNLDKLAYNKIPFYILHGNQDEVVPLEENSKILVDRYKSLGGPAQLKIVEGQGHSLNPIFFSDKPLMDFVLAHAQSDLKP